jgi:NitT/TauT family transport system ATP-binding protein
MADRVIVLSKRPAMVKSIHEIHLTLENERTPLSSREAPEFRHYFNNIWKELDVHVR